MWYEVENGEGVSAVRANLMVTVDEDNVIVQAESDEPLFQTPSELRGCCTSVEVPM